MASTPNLVYILADDMGYGDVSCLNPRSAWKTPAFDRLAAEGMAFTDAHAASAVCTPSRYSILTGRYNWRSSLKHGVLGGYSPPLVEEGRSTVASMLRASGYRTACVGKWHLGMEWARLPAAAAGEAPGYGVTPGIDYAAPIANGPTTRGFDSFYGIAASLDMPPYVYIRDDRVTALPDHDTEDTGLRFWRKGPTAPDFRHEEVLPRLTERALELIAAWSGTPFFLYFPLPAPHTPILPTGRFVGSSGTTPYGDFVLMCDEAVRRILAKLDELGIAGDTIVVYASDNGCSPMADFQALARFGHNPSHVFRGHKADIYEGGHRIPLLVRWPARIRAGSRCAETVCLSDLFATMAEIVGHATADDEAEDSVSNLALWEGRAAGPLREATVHHSINGSFSIRKGRWKLELCPGSGGWSFPRPGEEPPGSPAFQLYDLEADVGERRNLVAEQPRIADELRELLERYVTSGRSTPGSQQPPVGPTSWPGLEWMGPRG
jgi:arylsulfatase A